MNNYNNKIIVFTIGRFNPPTKGHAFLINTVIKKSVGLKSKYYIFTTQTHDHKKNPLNIDDKLFFLRQAFKGVTFIKVTNAEEALVFLLNKGYKQLIVILGEDRDKVFLGLFNYFLSNKAVDKFGNKFKSIKVFSLSRNKEKGGRDESASAAREAVKNNNFKLFKKISVNLSENLLKKLFYLVKKELGV